MLWNNVRDYVVVGAVTAFVGGCAGEQPGPVESELQAPLFAMGRKYEFPPPHPSAG
ncbi:MAG: hypothetical protein HYW06_13240 [Gemmatimonadetes bacterium]|nr:hypothetical protein [Gemmatimonadota bacterium]